MKIYGKNEKSMHKFWQNCSYHDIYLSSRKLNFVEEEQAGKKDNNKNTKN